LAVIGRRQMRCVLFGEFNKIVRNVTVRAGFSLELLLVYLMEALEEIYDQLLLF
jgi:hypothetical protein